MNPSKTVAYPYYRKDLPATILITALFVLFTAFFTFGRGGLGDSKLAVLRSLAMAFSALIIFLIFHTGHVDRWRKLFFSAYAVAFVISFVWWTMGDRGHMWLLDRESLSAKAPMCHIVVPMLILPILLKKEIIFPVAFASGAFMILLVTVVGIVYGRAFCSWGCFFGGQDQLFSSLPRTRRWRLKPLKPFVRYFSFGLLAFIVLHSFATMSPTYCLWLCPFKGTSEFFEVNSFVRVIQTFTFVSLWIVLAVLLPFLSKKRIQCGLFCPMGAFLSCTSKINLFGLRIDLERCKKCNRCIDACPTFSLTKESLEIGRPAIGCSKCGACIDTCPEGAVGFSTLGVPFASKGLPDASAPANQGFWKKLGADLWDPAVVFIFGVFVLSNVLASEYFVDSASRLLKYFWGI